MQFRMVRETLPNGNIRFFTQSRKADGDPWYFVDGTYSDSAEHAEAFFNTCVANGEGSIRDVIKESP